MLLLIHADRLYHPRQYYVKEIKAPTGYSLSTEVFALNANENVNVTEDYLKGNIIINKTAEDGIIEPLPFLSILISPALFLQALSVYTP